MAFCVQHGLYFFNIAIPCFCLQLICNFESSAFKGWCICNDRLPTRSKCRPRRLIIQRCHSRKPIVLWGPWKAIKINLRTQKRIKFKWHQSIWSNNIKEPASMTIPSCLSLLKNLVKCCLCFPCKLSGFSYYEFVVRADHYKYWHQRQLLMRNHLSLQVRELEMLLMFPWTPLTLGLLGLLLHMRDSYFHTCFN